MFKRLLLICLVYNNVWAECEPSLGEHFPSKTGANYYGNSRTTNFNCAVTGANELSSAQLSERADLLPESLSDRFYIKIAGNAAAEGISGATIKGDDVTTQNAVLQSTSNKTASNNFQLAFGYVWSDFAVDLEWLGLKSVSYDSTLSQITPSLDFTTNVKGDALLLNLYWIFNDLYNIQFYGLLSAGLTSNKSTSVFAGGAAQTLNKNGISYGLGVGGRFNVISKIYADMAVRYILLGNVKYQAHNPANSIAMTLEAKRTWAGISFGILWLI